MFRLRGIAYVPSTLPVPSTVPVPWTVPVPSTLPVPHLDTALLNNVFSLPKGQLDYGCHRLHQRGGEGWLHLPPGVFGNRSTLPEVLFRRQKDSRVSVRTRTGGDLIFCPLTAVHL